MKGEREVVGAQRWGMQRKEREEKGVKGDEKKKEGGKGDEEGAWEWLEKVNVGVVGKSMAEKNAHGYSGKLPLFHLMIRCKEIKSNTSFHSSFIRLSFSSFFIYHRRF